MILTLLASVSLAVWLYLIVFHGGFWRLTERDDRFAPPGAPAPLGVEVVAVIPARDEAEVIKQCLSSLFLQKFSGRLRIVLVDDQSGDGTSEMARACALAQNAAERLTVLDSGGPASGWTGKLAAMQRGFDHVLTLPKPPDFVLFCDADIAFDPTALERLATGALARKTVLASLMVKLRCESRAERWFVPAFVFFFQMLYPFSRVNNPKSSVAAAAGGVMLVRPQALARAGGLGAIRGALIDDCALGALLKRQGPIWLGVTDAVHSLRPYPGFKDIERMVTRSAYAQLDYSPPRLVGAILGMAVVYLLPPLVALFGEGWGRDAALVAYLLMVQAKMPALRFYDLPRVYALALPLVAACYTWFTLESARQHMLGQGGAWKGRYQARQGA
jgi:hopene-associated glycosyltransferase HpnB